MKSVQEISRSKFPLKLKERIFIHSLGIALKDNSYIGYWNKLQNYSEVIGSAHFISILYGFNSLIDSVIISSISEALSI